MAGTSYTRQSSMSDGDTITAALFNNEFNQLLNAFSYASSGTTGHQHDGGAGEGGNIEMIGDQDFLNKIVVDGTNNRWGFFVEVSSSAVEQIRVQDGAIVPVTDNDIDLGTSSLEFKDGYFDGTVTTDALVADTADINGGTVDGATIGASSATTIVGTTITANTAFVPDASDGAALGTTSLEFSDLYLADGALIYFGDDQDINITHVADTGLTTNGTFQATTITATTAFVPDASDGAALGTSALEFSDLYLADGAVVYFGDDQDVSLTHVADTGILLSSTDQLQFGDSGTYIHQSADGVLDLVSDTEIELTATTIDINGAVAMDGAMTGGTNITISGELDAATLDISGNADIDGTLEADAITIDGTALATFIRDTVGTNMLSSNTESGITVTYDTSNDNIDFAVDAAQTGITSILATDLKIGEDDQTKIDFETADEIHFYAANVEQVYLGDNIFGPQSDSDVDLGSSSVRWKDAYVDSITVTGEVDGASLDISGDADIDGTLEADAITVNGTALNEFIADTVGAMVGSNTETGIAVTYEDGDNTLDFVLGAAQTTITSLLATDIKIGEDDETKIDFETADTINFYAGNEKQLILTDGALTPGSNAIVDLGTDALEFKDAYFDGTVEADAISIGGTAITSTAAELNVLDGITAVVGELNALDIGATAVGTAVASKAVILDSDKDYTGIRNLTITGELDAATLDISGDVDIDGTLEADAITVNGTTLAETIADTTGAMVGSNTESGITVTYQDADNTIDFEVDAAQTGITSLLATDIKIGEDDQTKIDFETANEIHFYADNAEQVYIADGIFGPQTDNDVDLGASGVEWKDAYFDGTVTTDALVADTADINAGSIDGTTIGANSAAAGTFTTIADADGAVRAIPQSGSAKTSGYSLVTGDVGNFIEVGSSGAITIPNSTFSAGDAVSIFNNTTGNITITCSITTAYKAGENTDISSATLATRGVATILFISGTVCVISGNI